MPLSPISILNNPAVRAALKQAWVDSNPGDSGGHEEGGFIVMDISSNLDVVRWPKGIQDCICVPPHPDCKIDGNLVVASFHTHPNTGSDYLQEPSETDIRAVRDDPDLKGREYIGELVIASESIFFITPAGRVREVGETQLIFAEI